MRCAIPQPCIGSRASVLRIRRSRVPRRTSDGGGGCGIGRALSNFYRSSARSCRKSRGVGDRRTPRRDERHHRLGEPLHLLELRAELEEEEIDPGVGKAVDLLGDLVRRTDEPRLEPAIRDGVVLETYALLELRVGQPFLVISLSGGALWAARRPRT